MPQPKHTLPINWLRETFDYDAESGIFLWSHTAPNPRVRGKQVGTLFRKDSYRMYSHEREGKRQIFAVHRMVWAWWYGEWPNSYLDHADGNKTNNTISNLRLASPSENIFNRRCKNPLGAPGVSFLPCGQRRYRARIRRGNVVVELGCYYTLEEALAARREGEKSIYSGFFRSNGVHVSGLA